MDKALDTHTKFSKGSLSGWVEVLKYSVAGRPGAAVVNAGLEEEEGRVGAWRSAPAPEGREGMLLSGLWAGVHAAGRASWSKSNSGASQTEGYLEDVVWGLVPSLG